MSFETIIIILQTLGPLYSNEKNVSPVYQIRQIFRNNVSSVNTGASIFND